MKETPPRRRLLALALLLLLWIPLIFLFREFVRDVLLPPVLQFLWFANLALQSIPPVALWAYFLLVALRSIARSFRGARAVHRVAGESPDDLTGRVHTWARRIRLTHRGRYSKRQLAYYLAVLAADLDTYREGGDTRESKDRLRYGRGNAPPEIRDYFRAGLTPPVWERRERLSARLKGLLRDPLPTSPLDAAPDAVIAYLEAQLAAGGAAISPLPDGEQSDTRRERAVG